MRAVGGFAWVGKRKLCRASVEQGRDQGETWRGLTSTRGVSGSSTAQAHATASSLLLPVAASLAACTAFGARLLAPSTALHMSEPVARTSVGSHATAQPARANGTQQHRPQSTTVPAAVTNGRRTVAQQRSVTTAVGLLLACAREV